MSVLAQTRDPVPFGLPANCEDLVAVSGRRRKKGPRTGNPARDPRHSARNGPTRPTAPPRPDRSSERRPDRPTARTPGREPIPPTGRTTERHSGTRHHAPARPATHERNRGRQQHAPRPRARTDSAEERNHRHAHRQRDPREHRPPRSSPTTQPHTGRPPRTTRKHRTGHSTPPEESEKRSATRPSRRRATVPQRRHARPERSVARRVALRAVAIMRRPGGGDTTRLCPAGGEVRGGKEPPRPAVRPDLLCPFRHPSPVLYCQRQPGELARPRH